MKVTEATKERTRATQRAAEPAAALLVLTWNNYSDTAECIETLLRLDYSNYKIIGIDNHSTDGSIERLKREFPQVTFIENEDNFGFDVAMNRGLIYAFSRGYDYALLLNNDLTAAPDFLGKLVRVAESRPDIGVLSPAIYDYDTGAVDNMGWRFHPRSGYTTKIKPEPPESAPPVLGSDFVSGCAMLIKREVVTRVGLLDEGLYFLAEDLDYGLRCKDAGYGVVTVTGASVYHKNALSMPKDSPHRLYYGTRNHIKMFFRHRRHTRLLRSLAIFLLFDVRGSLVKALRGKALPARRRRPHITAILRGVLDGLLRRSGRVGVALDGPVVKRRRARVLFVESGGGFGGSMRSLAVLLSSPKWENRRTAVALTNPGAEAHLLDEAGVPHCFLAVPQYRAEGARVTRYLRMLRHLAGCLAFAPRFAAFLRRHRIGLVHLNNELFAGLPALLGACLAGVPVTCHLRSQRPPALVERIASLFCKRLVSISRTGARFFRSRLPVAGRRICAINDPFEHICTDRGQTSGRSLDGADAGDVTVGIMSNFIPGKGHEFFIDAVPRIAERFPAARFVVAGRDVPGNEGYLERLRGRAAANGAASKTEFLPWQADVPAFLARLGILVDCSHLSEGYRRTIVEGMLSGAAVVATDVGPAREIIRDRITGMLVRPKDARSLADAVCALLGDGDFRREIARNGRARVQKMFCRERSVTAMQKLFRELTRTGG